MPVGYGCEWVDESFLVNHPPGSAAHTSYFARITNGPGVFTTEQAARKGFALAR